MDESRRIRMSKRMMKDALLELMEEKPLSRISVTAICETADVNRSTFYAYYNETSDLLHDLENDIFEQMPRINDFRNIQNDREFMKLNTEFFDYIKKNGRKFKILMVNSENVGFYNRMTEKVLEMYKIDENVHDEQFRHYRQVYLASGAVGMLKEWIRNDCHMSSRKFAQLIMDVAVYGKAVEVREDVY